MLKIGHRGASGYAPENTIAAFQMAIDLGADAIELDVHTCKTGELVVIHDDTVDRTTNGKGAIADLTLVELRALGVPTLEDAFKTIGNGIIYFVEVKHANAAVKAAELMQRFHCMNSYLISFEHAALAQANKIHPNILIGASFKTASPEMVSQAQALGASAIIPKHISLQRIHVTAAHRANLKVFPWIVNAKRDIRRMEGLQADGIMSDYPDRLSSGKTLIFF